MLVTPKGQRVKHSNTHFFLSNITFFMEYDPEKKLCQLTLYLLDPVSFLSSAAAVAFNRISSYLFNNASCNSDR